MATVRADAPRGWTRRLFNAQMLRPIDYERGLPKLRRICGSGLLQSTLFATALRHLNSANSLGGPVVDPRLARTRHLLTVVGVPWRMYDLARRGPVACEPWLAVRGLHHISAAVQRGPVVVVGSHFGSARLVPIFLAHTGYRLLSLEMVGGYRGMNEHLPEGLEVEPTNPALDGHFRARSLMAAKRRLAARGILHIAGDGLGGSAYACLAFCCRMRPFAGSFAAIAVETGAIVVPAFAQVDDGGHVDLEFLPPLAAGSPGAARHERIYAILRGYADELERRWRADPANITPKQYKKLARLPVVDWASGAGNARGL